MKAANYSRSERPLMINTIGFIPNFTEVSKLKEFVPDEDVSKELEYLQIPVLETGEQGDADEIEERQVIKSTDSVLFCTINNEEISSVAFYGYDETEMFFHHDFFVFSTIIDSCYVGDSLVAVATFEPHIMVYDFTVEFPVLPQHLLIGHTSSVTSIKNKGGRLMSASEDKTVIEWDMTEMRVKNRQNYEFPIERFDFECSSVVFGGGTYLNINNENISLDYGLEQLRMSDNMVYVSDSEGRMIIYDVRMPSKPLNVQKMHSSTLVDFCLVRDWTVTTSSDMTLKMWKAEGAELKCKNAMSFEEAGAGVLALGFNPFSGFDEIFVGDEKDQVFPLKLEEKLQTVSDE